MDQKHTLDLFLECGAISQEQYDKSLGELKKSWEWNLNHDPESNL